MINFRKRRLVVPLLTAVALFAASLAAFAAAARARPPRAPVPAGGTTTIASRHTTKAGVVLVSSRGQVLFLFNRDRDGKSSCYGRCAREWRPLRAHARVVARRAPA